MRQESGFRMAANWPYIGKKTMTSQFANMTSWSFFFDVTVFLLSILVTGPSFMSISMTGSGVMTIFIYKGSIRNLEIGKKKPSEFCPIFGDWDKLGIPNWHECL